MKFKEYVDQINKFAKHFSILPDDSLQKNIINETEVLHKFLSELLNESKDLEGEIVEMVNNNFGKLLLKI